MKVITTTTIVVIIVIIIIIAARTTHPSRHLCCINIPSTINGIT